MPYSDTAAPFASVTVSGLFERRDADADFWVLYDRVLRKGASLTVDSLPLFVDEGGYFAVVGPALGRLESTYGWLLDVDTGRITVADKERAATDIEGAQQWINSAEPGFRISTSLLAVFSGYDERLLFTRVPMLVFLVTAAIVVLYYVATMASLTIDRRRTDIVLLRARGADARGVLAVFLVEGAGMVALAVALGPLVAAGAVNILGLTPALSDVSGGGVLGANVSAGSYLLSAVGGALGFGAILLASLQACRTDVSEHRQRQARPPEMPLFQRRYLDVMLLVIAVVLFWQLAEQGSVLAEGLFGEAAVNHVLLAAPGLALIAASMVLLRLFPLAMKLLGVLLARYSPAALMLGVWHIARNPTPYSRVFLLLVLMAGLGVGRGQLRGHPGAQFRGARPLPNRRRHQGGGRRSRYEHPQARCRRRVREGWRCREGGSGVPGPGEGRQLPPTRRLYPARRGHGQLPGRRLAPGRPPLGRGRRC